MGNLISLVSQMFPPRAKYKTSDIPDLTGKVIIVTGGNTGVGYYTVKALLEHNAKVYLAARSRDKGVAAVEKLKVETGKEAIFLELDLASLASVRRSVQEFKSKEMHLHILINNAGLSHAPKWETTEEGYDLAFGTNVLGHFYLSTLLLPILETTAQTLPAESQGDIRVVNVSSSGIYTAASDQDLLWNTLVDGPARRKRAHEILYCQSKVGNVLFSNELNRRCRDKGIISSSLNPGNLKTDLYKNSPWVLRKLGPVLIMYDVPYGALTSLWAATSKEGRNFGGQFLIPWARVGTATALCENEDVAKALWTWCEEQIAKFEKQQQ
ncbi:NAD-P-binding protein [Flagelloscypha sp. PMI_526]|nr:NAD-P-binding protein [Flagelloscypha sp. PMI_526]